jgi:hypothetical protein
MLKTGINISINFLSLLFLYGKLVFIFIVVLNAEEVVLIIDVFISMINPTSVTTAYPTTMTVSSLTTVYPMPTTMISTSSLPTPPTERTRGIMAEMMSKSWLLAWDKLLSKMKQSLL